MISLLFPYFAPVFLRVPTADKVDGPQELDIGTGRPGRAELWLRANPPPIGEDQSCSDSHTNW